ncbi:putative MFS transporter [Podospora didyma]|uniref:MFS transporter n=1 Tax=Podospora didyma TaxID=330526 RepID=A0AAE0K2C2_9PEZI|nr:putative MFS transporter [Podospora didyma]
MIVESHLSGDATAPTDTASPADDSNPPDSEKPSIPEKQPPDNTDATSRDLENGIEPPDDSEPLYSVFSSTQKRWIVVIAASAGWFSTASSFIYFPAIPFLASDLGVSVEKINLTVTSYLIASGVFPSVAGNAADRYGRRPLFLIALGVYAAVNVGLAEQRSFAALITLRMVQSAAISGTFSFAYGVLGDLTTPADRGGYIGFMSIFVNTPQSVAPMISGLLLAKWHWDSIFWFLTTASSVVFLLTVFFMPETNRRVVGNGSLHPPSLISKAVLPVLHPPRRALVGKSDSGSSEKCNPLVRSTSSPASKKMSVANPFSGLALLKHKGTAVAVISFGTNYALYSCLQASLSTIFVETYGVSGLVAGLSYIPFGAACIVASFLGGRLLDFDYKRTAKSHGMVIDYKRGDDISAFPIEYARLRTCKHVAALCAPLVVGYGWALQTKANIAVPLVLQFFIGFTGQISFTSLNALLLDFNPDRPSTIQATNNFFRCELAAGALALLDLMLRSLGTGWCYVLLAALYLLTVAPLWVMEKRGLQWRAELRSSL